MKHIVFFTLSMMRGGAEGVIARLCNDCFCKQYRITIVTCMNRPVEYSLNEKIELVCLDDEGAVYRNMGERFLKRRKQLQSLLDNMAPDLLISFLPEPNFLILSLKTRYEFPMIISVRNDPQKEYRNKAYYILMRMLYPKADGYVFQTKQAGDYFSFSKHITDTMTVIPNPLSNEFLYLQKTLKRDRKIVHVGRLDSQKNQKMLLHACKEIFEKYSEYTLEMYGEGRLRDELEQIRNEIGLKDKVIFCGNVPDLRNRIQNAAVFVLSSDYEGMPNALMEAMAMGIPVVSTDCPCGGPGYLIEDGRTGKLVPPGKTEELSKAVIEILNDSQAAEKMAVCAMERMKEFYPEEIFPLWEKYIQKYI